MARHRGKNPFCVVCLRRRSRWLRRRCDVHHVKPKALYPELAAEPDNLETVCRVHHRELGHPLGWRTWNPGFREDVIDLVELQDYIAGRCRTTRFPEDGPAPDMSDMSDMSDTSDTSDELDTVGGA